MLGTVGVQPRERQAVPPRELDELSSLPGRMRPDDLETDARSRLQPLPASRERPEQQVAERGVLEQERSQLLTLDGDVAHRRCHFGREEDGLPREQVRLPEEAARAVAVDLRAGLVEDGRLALDDRNQRIAAVTDPKEDVADLSAPLLAVLGKQGQLSRREHRRPGCHGRRLFPPAATRPPSPRAGAKAEAFATGSPGPRALGGRRGCGRRSRRATGVVGLDSVAVSAAEIDEYLRGIGEPKRATLEALRRTILEIVPDAEQVISYRVPAFRVSGQTVAGFAAFQRHLSYLPFSGSVLSQLTDALAGYEMTKSALHFPVDRPLPKALVRRLIAVRLGEL